MVRMTWFLLPITTGVLLAVAQFFMKRLSVSVPAGLDIKRLLVFVFTSPDTYLFVSINLLASVFYLMTLRSVSLVHAFAAIFFAMGFSVLGIDLAINRMSTSPWHGIGFLIALAGIYLMFQR